MNITYLIGNGFDLNLGLKTKFKDYLEEYMVPQPEDSELINSDIDLWSGA